MLFGIEAARDSRSLFGGTELAKCFPCPSFLSLFRVLSNFLLDFIGTHDCLSFFTAFCTR